MATTTATAAAAPEVRYGIVGVGMMGREHLHNLAHLAGEVGRAEPPVRLRVTCLADPHPESLQLGLQLAADLALPAPQIFSGHGELLDSGLCDAVVVSSPNMTHYQILMDIISHAKPHHILVEKPLCTTVQDCQKVSSNFGGSELCDVILMPAVLQNFTFMNTFKLCCSRCMWEVC